MMIPLSELVNKYEAKIKGVVHVGAHEGQELEDYLSHNIHNVIWIEANPNIYKTLCKRLEGNKGHKAYQFAAHEQDGLRIELNVMENSMSSSILYPKKHLELYPHVPVTEKIEVPTLTLDSFFKKEGFNPEDFNFLNMDIQGAELLTLKGSTHILKHFEYIYTELNNDHLFEDCALAGEMDAFLGEHGFRRVLTRMTKDDWGDAFYMKKGLWNEEARYEVTEILSS